MYADGQFVHDLVRLRVDFQDAVLVRPAVHIDVLAVLYHLFGGTRFHVHVWTFDIAGNLVCLGVDDEDTVVPYLRHIAFSSDRKWIYRGEVKPVIRPTSLKVLMSMAKITCELFTTIQPIPSRITIDWATSPNLNPLAR